MNDVKDNTENIDISKCVEPEETYKGSIFLRIAGTAILIIILLLLLLYGLMALADQSGQFTVSLGDDMEKLLSLSETADFKNPTTNLASDGHYRMTNTSGMDIGDEVDLGEGLHNGKNYFAYSFYLKNAGTGTFNYVENLALSKITKNIDNALRVRIYRDGVPVTYAKIGANGLPEFGTEAFPDAKTAVNNTITNFAQGQVIKYTIVIWVEGDDPECLDDIKGGNVKLSMTFSSESEDGTE